MGAVACAEVGIAPERPRALPGAPGMAPVAPIAAVARVAAPAPAGFDAWRTPAAWQDEEEEMKPGFAEEALPCLDAVYRFALRLAGGSGAEAEDLVQETYLRAYRSWNTYERNTHCRSWLFTICRNVARRAWLSRERLNLRNATDIDLDDIGELPASATLVEGEGGDPARSFFDSFVDEEVLRAVDGLPVEFRSAVVLSDLQGMSYLEIAEVMGVPLGTAKSRLHRGRRLLQKALYDYAIEMGYIRR